MSNEDTPEKLTGIRIEKSKTFAAGMGAVANSMKHILRESGLVHGSRVLLGLNQKNGFDCPSCAWPDPDDHRATTEFCENGAKAIASESTKKRITAEFFKEHSIDSIGEKSDFWHELQGRLTEPMFLPKGAKHYQPISWEKACHLIAQNLRDLEDPDDAIFYTSGRASNEAAFSYQLLARMYGTNNLPDCSNMCHESSGAALNQMIGIGKGTVTLEDFDHAESVFVIGQNPGTNHPRMLSALQNCVRNGGKIISVNPLQEAGLLGFAHPQEIKGMMGQSTALSSLYLQIKPNGDHALFKGMAKCILENQLEDTEFIKNFCNSFEEYKVSIENQSWETIVKESGLSRNLIEQAAFEFGKSKGVIVCWAMGLTQHKNAVSTIEELVNIQILTGNLGKRGAGLCPVRGHSNVQGDRTMGVFEKMPDSFHDSLDRYFKFQSPRKHGHDVVNAIKCMHEDAGKVFIALGGNFLSASPDTSYTAEALRNCKLTVQISTKLNRSHVVTGEQALILPCLGRSEIDRTSCGEQFVSMENSMGVVQSSHGRFKPASDHLKGEPAIVSMIGESLFAEKLFWKHWTQDYGLIRKAVEGVISGFENFNERVLEPGGFYLPNPVKERDFSIVGGKIHFRINPIDLIQPQKNQLVLMTIRSHDQFNTTVYGLDDRYRGIYNERRVLLMNRSDMEDRGIKPEEPVNITSHYQGQTREAHLFLAIEYQVPKGCAAAYFPEANALVPIDSTADKSNTPTSKGILITVSSASAKVG